jgi:lipocalin-like protein
MLVGVFSSAVLGCGSDSTGSETVNLVGTWHATHAQATSIAHPATTLNLIAAGVTLQVVFTANHTFTSTSTFPGNAPEISTGTYTQTATKLTLTNDQNSGGDVVVFDLALNAGTLSLTGANIGFDFGAGEEASRLDLTLVH